MNYTRFLLKASQWARNPPSEKRVKLVIGVILVCLILVGVEKFVGWPEWARVERLRGL
ncbi:hypothetical protein [Pseudooctadecabacter sp.]|uniref:hypothetical protein n=1 Tax=Pseudooctadecabacter sp. TaxID=1966338 RepID=UPI0025EE0522|nr:hypothetical protein [Pseudooctadecabacter sp.]